MKDRCLDDFLKTVSAVNDPTRILILAFISQHGESCVCEMEVSLELIQSRLSRHLKILKEAGFLEVERKGTWAYYKVVSKSPFHQQIIKEVNQLGMQIPGKTNACEINKAG